jgi:hypothetical protein
VIEPALAIGKDDGHIALRLLSALLLDWDQLAPATQGRLIREAALMLDGPTDAVSLPAAILAFIDHHKHGPVAASA